MALVPKPGLVVRYDYLWHADQETGVESGKDCPFSIILVAKPRKDGSRLVMLCPITHAPPTTGSTAITIPLRVAGHLGLDDQPCWIKTDEVNVTVWDRDRIPYGISQARPGEWFFGQLPEPLGRRVLEQVLAKAKQGLLHQVQRDD